MKYYIDGVIVVEGTNDESYLSSFIDAMYVCTNGYEVPEDELDFLREASKTKQVIILTDSDEAGMKIRGKLNQILPNSENAIVDLSKCDHKGKHGVKECEKEEIIRALHGFFKNKPSKTSEEKLFIGLDSEGKNNRVLICKTFHLGKCNTKKMYKRLEFLNVKNEDIRRTLENGNQ